MIPFVSPATGAVLRREGDFLVSDQGEEFPVVGGIPRFVSRDNYANAFGLQWKAFAKTQLDSFSGTTITRDRLERCLGFPLSGLKDSNVLEVGAGAGRFTELLVASGARTHSVDLSAAVEVNKENIGERPNYCISQASVYELPFPSQSFDVVICLGVIQHTPSSEKTIDALWQMVKPGGLLVIDHYKWRIGYYSTLTPLYRMVLKRMPPSGSKKIVDGLVDFFFPWHWRFRKAPALNWLLHRISPLIVYMNLYPEKNREFHYEWSKLDTYDQLTDYYKHLLSVRQLGNFLEKLGGFDLWINLGGNGIEARVKKKIL